MTDNKFAKALDRALHSLSNLERDDYWSADQIKSMHKTIREALQLAAEKCGEWK